MTKSKSQLTKLRARRRKQSALLDDIVSGRVASSINLATPLSLHPDHSLIMACAAGRSAIALAIRDAWISSFPTVTTMTASDLDRSCTLTFSS
jgi:hypothetical protein